MSTPTFQDRLRPYVFFGFIGSLFLIVAGMLQELGLPVQVVVLLAELLTLGGVTLVFTAGVPGFDWPRLDRLGVSPGVAVGLVFVGALFGLFANAVTLVQVKLLPGGAELARQNMEQVRELLQTQSGLLDGVAILSITVGAPLTEELAFRRGILGMQRRVEPIGMALLTNGALFALLHLNRLNFVALMILGAFFAFLAWRTRSVWPSIIAHASVNLTNGVILPRLTSADEQLTDPLSVPDAEAFALAGGLAVVVGAVWFGLAKLLPDPDAAVDASSDDHDALAPSP